MQHQWLVVCALRCADAGGSRCTACRRSPHCSFPSLASGPRTRGCAAGTSSSFLLICPHGADVPEFAVSRTVVLQPCPHSDAPVVSLARTCSAVQWFGGACAQLWSGLGSFAERRVGSGMYPLREARREEGGIESPAPSSSEGQCVRHVASWCGRAHCRCDHTLAAALSARELHTLLSSFKQNFTALKRMTASASRLLCVTCFLSSE